MTISRINILLLVFLSLLNENSTAKIVKTTRITLIENGYARVESIFKGEADGPILFFSDMIKSYSNFRNVSVKVNGKELEKNYYTAGVSKSTDLGFYGRINFKKYLTISGRIEIYMRFEVKIDAKENIGVIQINLAEQVLKAKKKISIDYNLVLKSEVKSYQPSIFNFQKYFNIEEYKDSVVLQRNYVSKPLEGYPVTFLVQGLSYSQDFDIVSEGSRIIKMINPDLIEEKFDYSLKGLKVGHIFLVIPLRGIKKFNNKPEINVNVDGAELSPFKLNDDEFSDFNFGLLKSPFNFMYYFGLDPHSNNNVIMLAFNLNENQIGNLKIKIEYNPGENLVSEDGFNFLWKYKQFSNFKSKRVVNNYYYFQIPDDFIIRNVSIDTSIINKGNDFITYNFINNSPSGGLEINFSRKETSVYNILRVINIIILLLSIFIIILLIFKIIPSNFIKIRYNILMTIVSFFYALGIGKFSASDFFASIEYTWAWVPFFITISLFIYSLLIEKKETSK